MDTKRSRRVALLLLALLLGGCAAPPFGPATDTLLILHTNDLHSHLLPHPDGAGGLARIGGYADQVRAGRGDVLLLDAGDAVTGTPVSTLWQGRPVFSVMTLAGYDASTLGNHEFDHGFALVAEYRRLAGFPLLCANVRGPDGEILADAPFLFLEADGVLVAVIGLATPRTPDLTAVESTRGCTFADPATAVRDLLPEVEDRADLVLVLSHLGHEEDLALARAVPGIDVIVGGHSHTEVAEPVLVGSTLVVQAGWGGRSVGRLELTVDLRDGRVIDHAGCLVPVDRSLPVSREVASLVQAWESRAADLVGAEVLGHADRPLDLPELRAAIERAFRDRLGADLAFMNPGGVRATIAAGEIRVRDLWNVLPFDNTLTTVRIRGRDLPPDLAPPDTDPERVYAVATNSFVSGHPDQYFPSGVISVEDSGIPMREAVIEAVRAAGGFTR